MDNKKENKNIKETIEKPTIPVVKTYKKYEGKFNDIDAIFASIGVPNENRGSYNARKPIADKNGIKDYSGTNEQNEKLITLARAGELKSI